MFRIYLTNNRIVIYDKSEKEFRQQYGTIFEQVGIVKDYDNIEPAAKKLQVQYRAEDIVHDYKKKRIGVLTMLSPEKKAEVIEAIREGNKRYKRTPEHCKNISLAKKGRAFFAGKKHSQKTRSMISQRRKGVPINTGRKWYHNPSTGEERLVLEPIEGWYPGRCPEHRARVTYALLEGKREHKLKQQLKESEDY